MMKALANSPYLSLESSTILQKLTLLVPSYRPKFVERFIKYHNDNCLLILPATSSNIKEYHESMSNACAMISTPYAMLADDDDFPAYLGIARACEFLDGHPEYGSARGRQVTFRISPLQGCYGRIHQLYWREPSEDCHRLRYAVYRTPILQQIWKEIASKDFNLQEEEDYFWFRAGLLGRSHFDTRYVTYFSQAGTGASYRKTWRRFFRFLKLRPKWDVERIKRKLASQVEVGMADLANVERALHGAS
jgi:hypothetical protein